MSPADCAAFRSPSSSPSMDGYPLRRMRLLSQRPPRKRFQRQMPGRLLSIIKVFSLYTLFSIFPFPRSFTPPAAPFRMTGWRFSMICHRFLILNVFCHSERFLCHSERQRRICFFLPFPFPRFFTSFRMTSHRFLILNVFLSF